MPESFSVWGVDVSNSQTPKVISRLKTGLLVGAPSDNGKTVGGSAPNFLASHAHFTTGLSQQEACPQMRTGRVITRPGYATSIIIYRHRPVIDRSGTATNSTLADAAQLLNSRVK